MVDERFHCLHHQRVLLSKREGIAGVVRLLESPCLNGGACKNEFGTYTCSCATGFAGANCEIDVNECESAPCLNDGLCVDGTGDYTCTCTPGHAGDNCEADAPFWFFVSPSTSQVASSGGSSRE